MTRRGIAFISFLIVSACANTAINTSPQAEYEETLPIVESRTTNYFTRDLEATTRFYTELLGLEEAYSADIKPAKSRETYGVSGSSKITTAGFFPPGITDDQKGFAGVAFFAIEGQDQPLLDRDKLVGQGGRIILAHRVKNVDEIERRMKAAGVPIVSALSLSATGRSRSMTVIDPNGIFIETYEYLEPK